MNSRDYEKILNTMPEIGVYVIQENTHHILYFNKRMEQICPNISEERICYEVWNGSCENCPLLFDKNKQESHSVSYNPLAGGIVDMAAARILWEDTIPAFLITITPRKAHHAYHEIFKVDFKKDCCKILKTNSEGCLLENSESAFSAQLESAVNGGLIHPDDIAHFKDFMDLKQLQIALCSEKDLLTCIYRYKYEDIFRWHLMEVIPCFNCTNENQTAIFCVKEMHDIPPKTRESEKTQQALQDRAHIIGSLSSLFFSTYYIDLKQDLFRVVSQPGKVGDVLGDEVNCTAALQIYANNFIHADDRDEYLKTMNIQNWLTTLRWWKPYVVTEYRLIPDNPDTAPEEYVRVRATAVLAQIGPDDLPQTVVYVAQNITEMQSQKH